MAEGYGALVLAAGKGTRMHSEKPKVLHEILGEPMLWYLFRTLRPLFGDRVWTVVGHKAEMLEQAFPEQTGTFVLQAEQLGTGHALQQAWQALDTAGLSHVLVVNGDTPLVSADALEHFMERTREEGAALSFISLTLEGPGAFGRVLRRGGQPEGRVEAIIEAKDYDPAKHGPEPREINAGIYCLDMKAVEPLLGKLTNGNKSGEYYITDLIDLVVSAGLTVAAVNCGSDPALLGVNSPAELVRAEEYLRAEIVTDWLARHVIIRQAESVRIGPRVSLTPGAEITGPCELYGATDVQAGARLLSHTWVLSSSIGRDALIKPFSHLEKAQVGPECQVGPYARLRPGAVLETDARVGNFVEVKNSVLGPGVKAGHLSYLGDAEVGAQTNIGAGTITCNYDGKNKHKTRIGKEAFIGSNTALVAPVDVGDKALVGAGSVITQDVPESSLSIARSRQKNLVHRVKS